MTTELLFLLAFLALVLLLCLCSMKGRRRKLTLADPDLTLDVELADNIVLQTKGLMGRKYLKRNEGMLFVFGKPGLYSFWMFNTSLPLDAIFFSEEGVAVDTIELVPYSLKSVHSKEKAKYILEVRKGFSKRYKIIVGKSSLRY